MKIFGMIPALTCATSPAHVPQTAAGWRGVVPLHSTRARVERPLGAGQNTGRTTVYRTADETVRVEYVVAPCRGTLPGWNVTAGTVLQLQVVSRKRKSLSELKLNEVRYVKTSGESGRAYYKSLEDGAKYEVFPDGRVHSVSYIPSAKDGRLRCAGSYPYDDEASVYRTFDSFGHLDAADEEARLDSFAVALSNEPGMRGYIVVYAGKTARPGEAKSRGERAGEYLINKRDIEPGRIVASWGRPTDD